MNKHLIITLIASTLCGLVTTPASAQSYQWAKNIGDTTGDYGNSIDDDKLKITIFVT